MINENKYDPIIKKYSDKYKLDWLLSKAQIKAESDFDEKAVNKSSGAMGLMQIMPKTWLEWEDGTPGIQDLTRDYDPFNPEDNIRVGCAYMHWLLNTYHLSYEDALRAYNWGIGNLLKWKKNGGTLPKETAEYTEKIFSFYRGYKS